MTPVQESRERKALFAPPRNAQPLPGEGGGWAAWWTAVRNGGWFLVLFMMFGLSFFLFGVAGTFGPYRDPLRETGDPRFFYAAMGVGALFALVALRMLQVVATGAGHVQRRKQHRVDARKPWTGDYPWKPAGQDPDGAGTGIGGMILGRVAFLGFIAFFNIAWTSGQWIFRIIIMIFDLFALLIVYDSVQKLWQGIRYARPRIVWLTFPAFTGSRLEASFRSRRRLHVTGPVRVTLRCVEDTWNQRPTPRGGAPSSQLEPSQVYEQVTEIPLAEDQAWIDTLRIDLAIPADLPGTDLSKDEAVYWHLLVQVPVLGPDFETVFLAPVYKKR